MTVLLNSAQRDSVYEFLLLDMSDLGDISAWLRDKEYDRAHLVRERFEMNARLLDRIGWEAEGFSTVYPLTMPVGDLRLIFARLSGHATMVISESMAQFAKEMLKDAKCVRETADMVFAELSGDPSRMLPEGEDQA